MDSVERILKNSETYEIYNDLLSTLDSIQEAEIIEEFELNLNRNKSISVTIRKIISRILEKRGWELNAPIFDNNLFDKGNRFKYDFLKKTTSVEFGFLHEMGVALKIIKGSLNSSRRLKNKNISNLQIIITVTNKMRRLGGFDSSIGTFEKFQDYLNVLDSHIFNPLIIIGIEGLETFKIKHNKYYSKTTGEIIKK